ncbi:MAG: PIN domain-containing protein [Dethiobacter sp.]|jgi:predicted nucleic acid-binding protein|nr:MAG: PIN domain-containing protein [Dethiobacter sp.]
MICYFDTSALVKLYVEEDGSDIVTKAVERCSLVSTSKVAYAEARAAFARSRREGILTEIDYEDIRENFQEDWTSYFSLEVTDRIIMKTGKLVERYCLRGFDAIHLASAIVLAESLKEEELLTGCWDARLWEAFRKAGFKIIPPEQPGKK